MTQSPIPQHFRPVQKESMSMIAPLAFSYLGLWILCRIAISASLFLRSEVNERKCGQAELKRIKLKDECGHSQKCTWTCFPLLPKDQLFEKNRLVHTRLPACAHTPTHD